MLAYSLILFSLLAKAVYDHDQVGQDKCNNLIEINKEVFLLRLERVRVADVGQ